MKLLEIPLNWDINKDEANELLYSLLQKDLQNYFPNTIEEFFQSPHKWILVDFLREIQFLASSNDFSFAVEIFFKDPTLLEMYSLAKNHTTFRDNTGFDKIFKSSEKSVAFIQNSLTVLNESITAILNNGYPFPKFIGKYPPSILLYFYEESTPIKYRGHIFVQESQLFTKKDDALFFISIYKTLLSNAQPRFADYVMEVVQKKAKQLNKEYIWTLPLPSMMKKLKEQGFTEGLGFTVHEINPLFIYWKKLNAEPIAVRKTNPFFNFFKIKTGGRKKSRRSGKKKMNKTRKTN